MSNEISRIYQFLSQTPNWVEEADTNGDGVLFKSELRSYLDENLEWNGESSDKMDLINQFWKTIDTNIKGDLILENGDKAKNRNALDKNEIANVTKRIEAYEIFNEFTAASIEVPSVISASANEYVSDVKDDLTVLLEQYLSSGQSLDNLDAYLTEQLPGVMNKNTAEYAAAEYLDSMKDLTTQYDYKFGDDKDLQKIIESFVSQLNGDVTPEEIQSTVQQLIDAYFATAGLKESNGINLADYGYAPEEDAPLNDLQKCAAEAKLTEYINQSYDTTFSAVFGDISFSSDEVKADFKEALESVLGNAKSSFIDNLTYSDYQNLDAKIKEFDLTQYVTDDMKTAVYKEYYSSIAEEYTNKLADRFAEGVRRPLFSHGIFGSRNHTDNQDESTFGFSLTNSELGSYSLDKDTIRQLMKDLNNNLNSFIERFIASGADPGEFEAQLQKFVENFLMGSDDKAITEAMDKVTADPYIVDSELDGYKETCISVIGSLLDTYPDLKLGTKALTTTNYREAVEAYEDGNDLMDDMEAMLKSINTEGKLAGYVEAAKEAAAAEKAEEIKESASSFASVIGDVKSEKLAEIVGDYATIHTEFGIDNSRQGELTFQDDKASAVFVNLISAIMHTLNENPETYEKITEQLQLETNPMNCIISLTQAAWIMTYNTFNSSQSNSTTAFVTKVLENLETILNKIAANPELLSVYTAHTSYADTSLTDGLIHYNTKTTAGGDQKISYKGDITTDGEGKVHIANTTDDDDYQVTMDELLKRLIKKYPQIDSSTITNVFREAQKKALEICQSNTNDCPHGTGNNGARVEDSEFNWGGKDNRKDDSYKIDMDQLVQLTLYCFDKLLYQAI